MDSKIIQITDEIKQEFAFAIASVVSDEKLNPDYIIPKALDEAVVKTVCESIENFKNN